MRRLVALPVVLIALAATAAGCRHDGRVMRPALATQNGSVSTSAPSTTPATDDGFFGTAATDDTAPIVTDTVAPTSSSTTTTPASTFTVTAPWPEGGAIDPRYTCKGASIAPALSWTAAPEGTQEIAITMIDLDFAYEHWALTGIAASVTSLAENITPAGVIVAVNGAGTAGYSGPCPPAGSTHSYRITVHYLDKALLVAPGVAGADLRALIDTATIDTAQVTGTFTGT